MVSIETGDLSNNSCGPGAFMIPQSCKWSIINTL